MIRIECQNTREKSYTITPFLCYDIYKRRKAMNHNYTLILDDIMPTLGIKIGIFYDIDWDHYDSFSNTTRISLFTLCYRPKHKDFVRIKHLNLPKRLQERYKEAYDDEKTIQELEGIGIHCYRDIAEMVDRFHEYQDTLVYENYQRKLQDNDTIYQKMLEVQDLLTNKKLVKRKDETIRLKDPNQ